MHCFKQFKIRLFLNISFIFSFNTLLTSTNLNQKALEIIVKDLCYDSSIIVPVEDSMEGNKVHEALVRLMNKASEIINTTKNEWYRLLSIQIIDATSEQYKVWDSLKNNPDAQLGNTKGFVQKIFERYSRLPNSNTFFITAHKNTWILARIFVDLTIHQLFHSSEDRDLYWKNFCDRSKEYLSGQPVDINHEQFLIFAADLIG